MATVWINHDIVVRYIDLPEGVHGTSELDEEGLLNVFLNCNDPEERQLQALVHEILHGIFGDHYIPEKAAEKKNRARMKIKLSLVYQCENE